MTGPVPRRVPGYRRWTALASTCAAEWRMTSNWSCATPLPLWLIWVGTSVDSRAIPIAWDEGAGSRFHPSSRRFQLRRALLRPITASHAVDDYKAVSNPPFAARLAGGFHLVRAAGSHLAP